MALRNALESFSEEAQLARLHELGADACEALFDLLMLGALIDGELSLEESEMLAEEFLHLPFYGVASAALVRREHGFLKRGELLGRIARGEVDEMLRSVAQRLPRAEHREAALRALALVLEIDGVSEAELGLGLAAARAMNLDDGQALAILRKAWELNHPPFT